MYSPFQTKRTLGVIVTEWGQRAHNGQLARSIQGTTVQHIDTASYGITITADSIEELDSKTNEKKRDNYRKILKDIEARSRELQRAHKHIEKLLNDVPAPGQKSLFE